MPAQPVTPRGLGKTGTSSDPQLPLPAPSSRQVPPLTAAEEPLYLRFPFSSFTPIPEIPLNLASIHPHPPSHPSAAPSATLPAPRTAIPPHRAALTPSSAPLTEIVRLRPFSPSTNQRAFFRKAPPTAQQLPSSPPSSPGPSIAPGSYRSLIGRSPFSLRPTALTKGRKVPLPLGSAPTTC